MANRPYAIDIITHITKREMDGGLKFEYYTTILSHKNDHGLWSLSTVEHFASSSLNSTEVILHLHPECTRSQQDLTLTEASELTCMPRWCNERPQSSL